VSDASSPAVPGWYGKLPSLGDFASRRLPAEFVQAWDAWLQVVLPATRAALGAAWLDCYLSTPIWRFVLLPELVDGHAWAGVLMPSVDRVGRQFPLTVAVALPSHTAVAHAVFEGADWFADLEEVALAALDVTRDADDLDLALADCAFAFPNVAEPEGPIGTIRRLPSAEEFSRLAKAEALRAWGGHAGWSSLWWTRGRVDDHPLMVAAARLPTVEQFTGLLQSRSSPTPSPGAAAQV
jgi:type VI secretion system protein ImpM